MRATLTRDAFDDPDWLFETKWDGFRVEAVVSDGRSSCGPAATRMPAATSAGSSSRRPGSTPPSAVVDGEVVAFDTEGEPDFGLLQQQIGRSGGEGGGGIVVYQAFDLLELDGAPLLERPLDDRKALLKKALRKHPRVRYSDHVVGSGIAAFEAARERGVEGIVAKDRRSPYLPGRRSDRWLKVKIRPEQELVVGGWTRGTGYAADFAALLVGVHEGGELRYAGKVGAGFTTATRESSLAALAPLAADGSPFGGPPVRVPAVHWVEPRLVIRAEFAGWTGDGKVRQAAYKGIDHGKDPKAVIHERPVVKA